MTEEPTDQDLIVGHPFRPSRWGDICEHDDGRGWICGYSLSDHAELGWESTTSS